METIHCSLVPSPAQSVPDIHVITQINWGSHHLRSCQPSHLFSHKSADNCCCDNCSLVSTLSSLICICINLKSHLYDAHPQLLEGHTLGEEDLLFIFLLQPCPRHSFANLLDVDVQLLCTLMHSVGWDICRNLQGCICTDSYKLLCHIFSVKQNIYHTERLQCCMDILRTFLTNATEWCTSQEDGVWMPTCHSLGAKTHVFKVVGWEHTKGQHR